MCIRDSIGVVKYGPVAVVTAAPSVIAIAPSAVSIVPPSVRSAAPPLGPPAHAAAALRRIPMHVLECMRQQSTRGAGALPRTPHARKIVDASLPFRSTGQLTLAGADSNA